MSLSKMLRCGRKMPALSGRIHGVVVCRRRNLGGRSFITGELHAQEPDWVVAFLRDGIIVKKVTHCLVEMAF